MQRLLRALQLMFRIGVPAALLVAVGAATFEHLRPRHIANQYLDNPRLENRILVGYSRQTTYGGDGSEIAATYIFVPSVFYTGLTYTVRKDENGSVKVDKGRTYPPLAVINLGVFLTLCVVAWRLPRIAKAT